MQALSLHIIVTHQIFKSLRPDNDNGVVWCPLPLAERGAYILINTKLKGSPTRGHENGGAGSTENEAVTTFFSQTLPELAVKDPSSKKQAEEYVVDSDLFAEAMLGLLMAGENLIGRLACRADRPASKGQRVKKHSTYLNPHNQHSCHEQKTTPTWSTSLTSCASVRSGSRQSLYRASSVLWVCIYSGPCAHRALCSSETAWFHDRAPWAGLLNAKLEDEFLMEEFEKLVAKNDNKELTYDELLFFVRQHPLGIENFCATSPDPLHPLSCFIPLRREICAD